MKMRIDERRRDQLATGVEGVSGGSTPGGDATADLADAFAADGDVDAGAPVRERGVGK
jgi:hypothetical protein